MSSRCCEVLEPDFRRQLALDGGGKVGLIPAVRKAEHGLIQRHQVELQPLPVPAKRRRVVFHRLLEAALREQRVQRVVCGQRAHLDDRVNVFGGAHVSGSGVGDEQPGGATTHEHEPVAQGPEGARHREQQVEVRVSHGGWPGRQRQRPGR